MTRRVTLPTLFRFPLLPSKHKLRPSFTIDPIVKTAGQAGRANWRHLLVFRQATIPKRRVEVLGELVLRTDVKSI